MKAKPALTVSAPKCHQSVNLIGKGHSSHYMLHWCVFDRKFCWSSKQTHTQTRRVHAAARRKLLGRTSAYLHPSFVCSRQNIQLKRPYFQWINLARATGRQENPFKSQKSGEAQSQVDTPRSRRKSTIGGHRGKVIKTEFCGVATECKFRRRQKYSEEGFRWCLVDQWRSWRGQEPLAPGFIKDLTHSHWTAGADGAVAAVSRCFLISVGPKPKKKLN